MPGRLRQVGYGLWVDLPEQGQDVQTYAVAQCLALTVGAVLHPRLSVLLEEEDEVLTADIE